MILTEVRDTSLRPSLPYSVQHQPWRSGRSSCFSSASARRPTWMVPMEIPTNFSSRSCLLISVVNDRPCTNACLMSTSISPSASSELPMPIRRSNRLISLPRDQQSLRASTGRNCSTAAFSTERYLRRERGEDLLRCAGRNEEWFRGRLGYRRVVKAIRHAQVSLHSPIPFVCHNGFGSFVAFLCNCQAGILREADAISEEPAVEPESCTTLSHTPCPRTCTPTPPTCPCHSGSWTNW